MHRTPCARSMKSITPNTSVSPAAIRNSSTPSCRPLSVWTMRRVVLMARTPSCARSPDGAKCNPGYKDASSLHPTILHVRVGVVREHLLGDLGLVLAVGALRHLDQVEILNRIVV